MWSELEPTEQLIDTALIFSYWVTQKLPQICTVILRICIWKVAVYIYGNFWVTCTLLNPFTLIAPIRLLYSGHLKYITENL